MEPGEEGGRGGFCTVQIFWPHFLDCGIHKDSTQVSIAPFISNHCKYWTQPPPFLCSQGPPPPLLEQSCPAFTTWNPV